MVRGPAWGVQKGWQHPKPKWRNYPLKRVSSMLQVGLWERAWIEADNVRQEGQGRSSELMAWLFISELRVDMSQREQARNGDNGLKTKVNSRNGIKGT